MSSNLLVTYLGAGLAASRPATPSLAVGTLGLWWSTDTKVASIYDLTNASWGSVGGFNAGTVPTVVQSIAGNTGGATGGGAGLTLGTAPTSGNLLIAMCFNTTTATAGSGWTQLASNSSGTDYGTILYKVAGGSESTTQTPLTGTVNAPACMVIWEINGQNGTIGTALAPGFWTTEAEQSSQVFAETVLLPALSGCLFLGAIGLVSTSYNLVKTFGATQDQLLNTGTGRQIAAGHSSLGSQPMSQLLASLGGSSSYKALGLLVSS